MLQCAQDLVSYWVQDHVYDDLDIDKNTLATPFHDTLQDSLTGFYIDIKLEQGFPYNSCTIPMSGVTPPPSPSNVTITINGNSFTTAICGTTEDIDVKDTNGLAVGSKVGSEWIVPAAGGGDPATNSMNGTGLTDIPAGDNKDFTIRYANDDPVVVTTITDNATTFIGEVPDIVIASNTSQLHKTGQTTSFQSLDDGHYEFGSGTSFLLLDVNNPFGNLNRFTDDTGAQTYASAVIVDWTTYNSVNDTVTAYYQTPILATRLDTALTAQPYTRNSLSSWYVINALQFVNIWNFGVYRDGLNYAPFNYAIATDQVWTSTMGDGVNRYMVYTGVNFGDTFFSQTNTVFLTRNYTLAELGL